MGMMRPDFTSTLRRAALNPARSTGEGVYNVESRAGGDTDSGIVERVVSPAEGKTVRLHPPGRILAGSVGVRNYRSGIHFEEVLSGSPRIRNLDIPPNRTIEVTYFLEDDAASKQAIPVLTADPKSSADGELWIRIDLFPPELRVARRGIVFAIPFQGVPSSGSHGRYPSRNLHPPFYPSRGTAGAGGRYPSSTLHPPFYPSAQGT